MTTGHYRLGRRRAVLGFGALSLSPLLPACGSSGARRGPSRASDGGLVSIDPADGGAGGVTCNLTPAQIEGPFFVDTGLMRSDLRDGKSGVVLELELRVVEGTTCAPIPGALVEVWHADANGAYSAFDIAQGNSQNQAGETFLRGYQRSNEDGRVEFLTVYPGWYPGRTPHIHVMVLLEGRTELLTTQLYFPEAVTDAVYAREPYAARGLRSTTNATDGVGAPEPLISQVAERGDGFGTAFRMVVPRQT